MNSGGVEVSAIDVEKMPSEYSATAGSVPTAFVRRPTPRIARRSSLRYATLGVKRARSSTVLTPSMVRVSLVYADTATGTSCMLTSRFSAVTITSSRTLREASCAETIVLTPSTLPIAHDSSVRCFNFIGTPDSDRAINPKISCCRMFDRSAVHSDGKKSAAERQYTLAVLHNGMNRRATRFFRLRRGPLAHSTRRELPGRGLCTAAVPFQAVFRPEPFR